MKTLKIFLVIFLLMGFSQQKFNGNDNELKNKILKNIRCLICQGQSVYDSESDFAFSIKLIVNEKIKEGMSEDQVYKFLREKYGDWIIYAPKLNKNTYVLWLLPLLLFLAGGAIINKNLIFKK
tara:strand:- start:112 stop:480 length:369 start_codon:yes stop_codon:yes gene_type:complete